MINYPEYVKINDKKYKINTDFRFAIECNRIAEDNTINDIERSLAIIYTLFGDEGIDNPQDYEKLLEMAQKYLLCGKEYKDTNEKPNMNFEKDAGIIASSFQYDYSYNPYEMEYCHWYKFYNDLVNLSDSEFGNCCALSNVRNLRDFDESKIEDREQRKKVHDAKMYWALDDNNKKKPSEKQKESAKKFFEALGYREE